MSDAEPRVFVVDDEASVRESLRLLIESAGWQPVTFRSAQEFLAQPRVWAPSCLLLDVVLPDLNGCDLQKLLADRTDMPIIFISGHGDVPTTVRAMKAGAADFFTKPLPDRAKAWLDAAMNLVFAAVAVILTWRLVEGGIGVYERDKRSMFLQLPDWWAYGVGAVAMLLWIATCLLIAWEGVQRARGRLAPAQESPTGFA
jgi:CheY-like chemotaxis protein